MNDSHSGRLNSLSRGKRQVVAMGVVQKESRRRGRGRLLPPLWMGERQTGKYSKHQADRGH